MNFSLKQILQNLTRPKVCIFFWVISIVLNFPQSYIDMESKAKFQVDYLLSWIFSRECEESSRGEEGGNTSPRGGAGGGRSVSHESIILM